MSIKSEESTAQTVNEECNISGENCDYAIIYTGYRTFNSFEVEGPYQSAYSSPSISFRSMSTVVPVAS